MRAAQADGIMYKQKQSPEQNQKMNRECLCDCSSDEFFYDNIEYEPETFNRIFLNFSREFRHPAKDKYNIAKVKELFKCLAERSDLQEMKVSGRSDEGKEKSEDEEEEGEGNNGLESLYGGSGGSGSPRGCGKRFAMSRDFWYRKLNTLKAQKLDEAALEAKDLPPGGGLKDPECLKWIRNHKIYSDELPENRHEILEDIDRFNESVAKPVEKQLKCRFVNVYDNRNHFKGGCA